METIEDMLNMDKAKLSSPVNTVQVRQRMINDRGGGGGRMDCLKKNWKLSLCQQHCPRVPFSRLITRTS